MDAWTPASYCAWSASRVKHRDPIDIAAHEAKVERTLDMIEADPQWLEGEINVGILALVCANDRLIFHKLIPYPLIGRPHVAQAMGALAERPALIATRP